MKVTISDIAEALGVSRQAMVKRAQKQDWQPTGERVKGGGNVYELESLPLDKIEMRKVKNFLDTRQLGLGKIDTLLPAPTTTLPSTANATPALTEPMVQKAMLKADLLHLYTKAIAAAPWGKQVAARDEFVHAYNSGLAWPELYKQLGPMHWKTIEGWKQKVKKNGNDTFALADRRGLHNKGACVLDESQTDILLHCALRPNRPRISEAIRMAHAVMQSKGISNGYSADTYRRWLKHWKERNYHIWVFLREGAKAWNDQCAYYIERDMSLLNVGDVIVADGHNLNFEIINPWTGKRQNHMTLILFYDMASNMPLGWEIMPTENTAAISSALRRAILRLGKKPQVVYLDNGRAFKAKFFQGSASFDEAGYTGLYERLGCQTIFAWPYHGQSKTIERFFGSFSELERMCPTYTGTSIEHKPPRMMRGEKLHNKVHEKAFGDRCLTMEDAHHAIAAWFDEYAHRPQKGHLKGGCPMDMFLDGRGLGVDKAELTWLMMSMEIKTLHRNGFTFRGQNYYHPALSQRRHPVTIRYDLQDQSSIFVFDLGGEYLCEATPTGKIHPAAAQLGNDADKEALRQHIEHKRGQEKEASASARTFLRDVVLPEHQRQLEQIGVLVDGPTDRKQLPAPKVVSIDAEKLAREVAENARLQKEADERDFRQTLLAMNNSDRFERLLELEAQGVELAKEWTDFMGFFPVTSDYTDHAEYWEQRRMAFAIMYRSARASE